VVTCAPIVKNPKPVIPPEWLKLGSVAVSLDVDATIMATTAHAANGMRVDNGEQFEYYRRHGHFADMPTRYKELAELVSSGQGRCNATDRYVVSNLGLALEDMAAALPLYRRALEREIGTLLPC
jgi:ornithine cyclodeaminase/alanine dehydrogenase-like protein (mu-crystallin family)